MKFNLPAISSSSVQLSDSDIIESKTTEFAGVLQGVSVYNGIFAIPYSENVTGGCNNVGVQIFDFLNANILFDSSIMSVTKNELEGVCIYDGKIFIIGHKYGQNNADAEYIELTF